MNKISVYSAARGVRTLKEGISLAQYNAAHPDYHAIPVKKPSLTTLAKWSNDGHCKTVCGCWTEPDGSCGHGNPSWLLALGLI